MTDAQPTLSDPALVAAARDGSAEAWAQLRARHIDAVRAVAASTNQTTGGGVDAAMQAFRDDVLQRAIERGVAGVVPERGVLALRPRAIAALTGGHYGPDGVAPEHGWSADDVAQEFPAVATAFTGLPELWQTVLWHRIVECATAADVAVLVGRSPAAVRSLEQTAGRGLFDAYAAVVVAGRPPVEARCRPIVPQLGAYQRATLPAAQVRAVGAHLDGCDDCRRRLAVGEGWTTALPAAIVPALTTTSVDAYRGAIGVPVAAGTAALAAGRAARSGQRARVVAVAAVVVALLAAAFFIRGPFGDLDPRLADLMGGVDSTTTTTPGVSPDDSTPDPVDTRLPSRIEFVLPSTPQGAVYVPGGRPLDVSVSVSTPGPMFEGGTGTVDARLTNNDSIQASLRFFVRASEGIEFERLSEGDGQCRAEDDGGATCAVTIGAGRSASMSMRFVIGDDVPDRLVIAPGAGAALEVDVDTVADLLVGTIDRSAATVVGAALGSCADGDDCASGEQSSSSTSLVVPSGSTIVSALLVWEGDDPTWADEVRLAAPGSDAAVVAAERSEPAPGGQSFRSMVEVTELVAAAGSGRYTVERPERSSGGGSWSLVVLTSEPSSPRRLVVVTAPRATVSPAAPLVVDIPIAGSEPPPAVRSGRLHVLHRPVGTTSAVGHRVEVVGASVSEVGAGGEGVNSYDLEIEPTDALSVVASTSSGDARVAAVGVAVDLPS